MHEPAGEPAAPVSYGDTAHQPLDERVDVLLTPGDAELLASMGAWVGEHTELINRQESLTPEEDPAVLASIALQKKQDRGHGRQYIGELLDAARHDSLTGLANRDTLHKTLQDEFDGARRSGEPPRIALFEIDLENFKEVNDRLGHDFGDEVLVAVGMALRGTARHHDIVARPSGDEFWELAKDFYIEKSRQRKAKLEELQKIREDKLQGLIADMVRRKMGLDEDAELPFYVGATVVFGVPRRNETAQSFKRRVDRQLNERKEARAETDKGKRVNYTRRKARLK